MNHTTRLLIPAALALAAMLLNWMAMQSTMEKTRYVTVKNDVTVGNKIGDSVGDFAPIELSVAEFSGLEKIAVRWEDLGLLLDRPATRDLSMGDVVFWRDVDVEGPELELTNDQVVFPVSVAEADVVPGLLRIGGSVYFRFQVGDSSEPKDIGPFKIVTIGSRFTNDPSTTTSTGKDKLIGVAFPSPKAPKTTEEQELQNLCDQQAAGQSRLLRILHVPAARPPGVSK